MQNVSLHKQPLPTRERVVLAEVYHGIRNFHGPGRFTRIRSQTDHVPIMPPTEPSQ